MALHAYDGRVRVIVMPEEGEAAIEELIDAATKTLHVKMFEFTSEPLIRAVLAAKERGVDVVVLLNPVRSNGARPNDPTFERFQKAGIAVDWTSDRFKITHEKSMAIDGTKLLISTFNYSEKYLTKTRDFGVLVDDPDIISEVTECFDADRAGVHFEPRLQSPLAWGNCSARRIAASFIDEAEEELWIQHPKFHDVAILEHVLAARLRGVKVRLLCGGAHGIEEEDLLETFCHQRILAQAGVNLRKQKHLKLHAKLMIADGSRAMVGSMNIDREAFDVRRELGLLLEEEEAVDALRSIFKADWHDAHEYEAPDPILLNLSTVAEEEAEDEGIDHE